MSWIKTVSISGFEQGNIRSSGESSTSSYVRSTNFTTSTSLSVKATISVSTGKSPQFHIAGYSSPSDTVPLWVTNDYTSGTAVNLSSLANYRCLRVVVGYTNSSAIVPEDITSCTLELEYHWIDNNGSPTNPDFPQNPPDKPFTGTLPKNLWRINSTVNDGIPYHLLMPGLKALDLYSLTRTGDIRIYDYHEPQDGFQHNGLAVLLCSDCTSKHELNGRWDIELRHPIDDYGIWKNISPENVLKIDGQLFRIDEVEPSISADKYEISAHAKHMWYDLADTMIFATSPDGLNGYWFINFCFSNQSIPDPALAGYDFGYYSDITDTTSSFTAYGISIAASLIGVDDCMINRLGGELYRNNFYFSINSRMEGAKDNAFVLRFGVDFVKFVQNVDQSSMVTFFHADDNYGSSYAEDIHGTAVHHHRHGYKKFTYPNPDFDGFCRDAHNYFEYECKSKTLYKISVPGKELPEEFKELAPSLRVGDKGRILCKPLNIDTVREITYIEKNELTGEIKNITFGGAAPSLIRPAYMSNTVSSGNSVLDKQAFQLQTAVMSTDINGMQDFSINQLGFRTISELEGI